MPSAIALIPANLEQSALGLPSRIADRVHGQTVLAHTVTRAARIENVEKIVIVHPRGQDFSPLIADINIDKPILTVEDPRDLRDACTDMRQAARKWSLGGWRGGLGGALCYDELLPATSLLHALREVEADAAILIGGDWLLVDPEISRQCLALHLEHPETMKMTFTQSPPGLAGVAVSAELLETMSDDAATFGQMVAYDPKRPQADPIGRDVCIQIPPAVRNCARRFIYDTPRTRAMIDVLGRYLGDRFATASAIEIVDAFTSATTNGHADQFLLDFGDLPQQITLELNTRRRIAGPLAPQHYQTFDDQPIETERAVAIVEQLGAAEDVVLTLGGLGDPLLHPDFSTIVETAHRAGVFAIAIETDLLITDNLDESEAAREQLGQLLDLPIDVISVRLNADTPAVYEKVMGADRFNEVVRNIEWLINTRNRRSRESGVAHGVPWFVPRFIKTADNLADLEGFFDRWMHFARAAVIESPTTAGGQMPDLALMHMAPPRRYACRQIARRLTIRASGQTALCDQDWHGAFIASASTQNENKTCNLTNQWHDMQSLRRQHRDGQWDALDPCATCNQWHRP